MLVRKSLLVNLVVVAILCLDLECLATKLLAQGGLREREILPVGSIGFAWYPYQLIPCRTLLLLQCLSAVFGNTLGFGGAHGNVSVKSNTGRGREVKMERILIK
jgi:hypothetical protein